MVRRLNPLLGVGREDLRRKSVWQAERDGIIDLELSRWRSVQYRISTRHCRRHHSAIKTTNDRRVGVVRSNLMIESGAGVHAGEIRFALTRTWHFPVCRSGWKVRRTNVQTTPLMRRTDLVGLR